MTISGNEYKTIVLASIVVALTLAFDDGRKVFVWRYWVSNFLITVIIVIILLLIFIQSTKYIAKKAGLKSTFGIWEIKRTGISRGAVVKTGLYVGMFIPIVVAFATQGKIPCGTAMQYEVEVDSAAKRWGRKFHYIEDKERARIAVAGPFTMMMLALLVKIINFPFAEKVVLGALTLAVSTMLPLPKLNGLQAFMASRPMYTFYGVFIVITTVFMKVVSPILLFCIGILLAMGTMIFEYYKVEAGL